MHALQCIFDDTEAGFTQYITVAIMAVQHTMAVVLLNGHVQRKLCWQTCAAAEGVQLHVQLHVVVLALF